MSLISSPAAALNQEFLGSWKRIRDKKRMENMLLGGENPRGKERETHHLTDVYSPTLPRSISYA